MVACFSASARCWRSSSRAGSSGSSSCTRERTSANCSSRLGGALALGAEPLLELLGPCLQLCVLLALAGEGLVKLRDASLGLDALLTL